MAALSRRLPSPACGAAVGTVTEFCMVPGQQEGQPGKEPCLSSLRVNQGADRWCLCDRSPCAARRECVSLSQPQTCLQAEVRPQHHHGGPSSHGIT